MILRVLIAVWSLSHAPATRVDTTSAWSTATAKKLFSMRSSGRELAYIDEDGAMHVNPGVTAEDMARAWMEYAEVESKRYEALRRDIDRVLRIMQGPPRKPDRL